MTTTPDSIYPDTVHRYLHDPPFHRAVNSLTVMISEGSLTAEDLRFALDIAEARAKRIAEARACFEGEPTHA